MKRGYTFVSTKYNYILYVIYRHLIYIIPNSYSHMPKYVQNKFLKTFFLCSIYKNSLILKVFKRVKKKVFIKYPMVLIYTNIYHLVAYVKVANLSDYISSLDLGMKATCSPVNKSSD